MGHTDTHTHTQTCRGISGLLTSWAVCPTLLAGCVLAGAGTVAQRAPGVLLPVCSCVEVLGLSMDRDGTRRLLKLALKAATAPQSWQVSSLTPGAFAQVPSARQQAECRGPAHAKGQAAKVLQPSAGVLECSCCRVTGCNNTECCP